MKALFYRADSRITSGFRLFPTSESWKGVSATESVAFSSAGKFAPIVCCSASRSAVAAVMDTPGFNRRQNFRCN